MLTAILFVVMLLVLVISHEWGHMMVAKLCGVKVNEFSVGMGPLLYQKQKGDTMYSVRLLPLGGFCAMEGEEETVDSPTSYSSKSNLQKIAILLAGVTMNILIAILVAILVVGITGFPSNTLESVSPGSPAEAAGLRAGDVILEIDGHATKDWEDVTAAIDANKDGKAMHFVVKREGEAVEAEITPEYVQDEQRYVVGIVTKYKRSFGKSITGGVRLTGEICVAFAEAIKGMFTHGVKADDVAGPVGLVRVVNTATSYGVTSYLMLLILVSLNLAFFNLLPIPGLDGGKIFFIALKFISGGRITDDMEYKATVAGMVLLIAFAILITFNDIKNLFG